MQIISKQCIINNHNLHHCCVFLTYVRNNWSTTIHNAAVRIPGADNIPVRMFHCSGRQTTQQHNSEIAPPSAIHGCPIPFPPPPPGPSGTFPWVLAYLRRCERMQIEQTPPTGSQPYLSSLTSKVFSINSIHSGPVGRKNPYHLSRTIR